MAMARKHRGDRIVILHGAVAPDAAPDEQDVLVEVETVRHALAALGYAPTALPLTLDLEAARRRLRRLDPAFVFNLLESLGGESRFCYLAPTLLDSLGLPYSGSGAEAAFLTSAKPVAKRLLGAAGLPTAPWVEWGQEGGPLPDFPGPYILKPASEDASIGIDDGSVVEDARALPALFRRRRAELGGEWFVERYVEGREFNLALLAGPNGPELLPPAEIRFVDYPPEKPRIVGYAAKWQETSFEYHHTPRNFALPPADAPLLERMGEMARRCWRLFQVRGYARVDLRVDAEGRVFLLEVNVNPCISPDAGFLAAAAQAGLGLEAVMARILADPAGAAATRLAPARAGTPARKRLRAPISATAAAE
jgi:D-alanine-D-alanine ligase